MEESIQCYISKKKKPQKFHKGVVGFFFFLKVKIFFSSPEMNMEINLPFSKKFPSKFFVNLVPSVPDKVQNISISDTTISIHTFRVRYMNCSFHCEKKKKKLKKCIYSYKGCSSSLIRSFMSFWDEIGLLLRNSVKFHLLL